MFVLAISEMSIRQAVDSFPILFRVLICVLLLVDNFSGHSDSFLVLFQVLIFDLRSRK